MASWAKVVGIFCLFAACRQETEVDVDSDAGYWGAIKLDGTDSIIASTGLRRSLSSFDLDVRYEQTILLLGFDERDIPTTDINPDSLLVKSLPVRPTNKCPKGSFTLPKPIASVGVDADGTQYEMRFPHRLTTSQLERDFCAGDL